MTRLEDLLRDSLAERADDVESTPALWHRVEARTVARARRTWALAAAGTAMAVVAGAVVLPDVLDRTPERPTILIDPTPSPAPSATDGDAAPDAGPAAVDPTASHAVAVVDGMLHWYDLDGADGGPVLFVPGPGEVLDLAVRPRTSGDDWHVAVVAREDGQLHLRVVVLPEDAVELGLADGFEVRTIATQPDDGDLQPGVAWAPDGSAYAWLRHDGGETRIEAFDGREPAAAARLGFCCTDRGLLADGAIAGRLSLQAWTWDVTYEDGVEGRLFLGGDGRSWQVSVTQDADTSLDHGGLDPIGLAADAGTAGPLTGPVGLRTVGLGSGELFAIERLDDGTRLMTWSDESAVLTSDGGDVAMAGDQFVARVGNSLFFGDEQRRFTRESDATIGVVDLAHTPWTAPFVGDEADDPARSPATEEPGPVADLPEFAVRANGTQLQVVRNWLGEGEPEVVRSLGAAPAFEGDPPIHGVSVRPGSTLDDLEAVALVLNEGMYEYWWVRSLAGDVAWEQFERQHQPVAPAGDDLKPVPVFSQEHPSGDRYLAWVDHHEGGDQTVRIIGWTDGEGPGTGDPADDNTAFAVPDRQLLQLDAWEWERTAGDGWTTAQFWFTSWDEQGQSSALFNEFDRGPDGAMSIGAECFCGEPGHGSHTHEAVRHDASGWNWELVSNADGNALIGGRDEEVQSVRPTMPPALRDAPGAASLELRAWAETAVVLQPAEGRAWVVRSDGSVDTFEATAFDFLA